MIAISCALPQLTDRRFETPDLEEIIRKSNLSSSKWYVHMDVGLVNLNEISQDP